MRIANVETGAVSLDLDPGECLLLARACQYAADEHMGTPTGVPAALGQLYYTTKCYLEALAMLADAKAHTCRDLDEWMLDGVREDWAFEAPKGATQ